MDPRDFGRRMFKSEEELELTSGSIARPLFHLSLPIVVMNLLQTTYNLADTFWLGQYDTAALAATSFTFPMVLLYISVGLGISAAGSILVAQRLGAGDRALATSAASQTVTLSVIGALVLGGLGYLFVDDLLTVVGPSERVLKLATEYMRLISLGSVFIFGFVAFMALMRGAGDTVTPMLVVAGSVGLNVALDPVLIFGWGPFPQWGIRGAAIATVASRALAFGVGLWVMFRWDRGVSIAASELWPTAEGIATQLRLAVPASVEGISRTLSLNLLLVIVGTFSTTVVAGYGIGMRVLSVVYLPAIAVARGVETMTGQNIGAVRADRAETATHFAGRVVFGLLAVVGIVTWLQADTIVGLFTTDVDVARSGTVFLRYVAPTFGFIGLMRVFTASLRGAGKTLSAALLVLLVYGVLRLPVAQAGALAVGPAGVWTAIAATNLVGALLAYAWYRRGAWRPAAPTDQERQSGVQLADD
ncbi:MAG: putative MATE family efflux protein [Haloarculaceae archaeon]|jgi:putative MATE family efflux protein